MGIESQHAYRFGYLKSEQWQTVRIEALAREKGRCQVCEEFSVNNDAHHVEYPSSIWQTKAEHLAILCRPCHQFIHAILAVHDIKQHTQLQFKQMALAIRGWKIVRQEWLDNPVKEIAKRPKCKICECRVDNVSDLVFFLKFGFLKITTKACSKCHVSAAVAIAPLESIPDKPFRFYVGWKKQRMMECKEDPI